MSSPQKIVGFSLPSSEGKTCDLEKLKGQTRLVLVFLSDIESEADLELLDEIDSRIEELAYEKTQVLVFARMTARAARNLANERSLAVTLLADATSETFRGYGALDGDDVGARCIAVVADKDGTIIRRFDPLVHDGDVAGAVDAIAESFRAPER